jgi:membrane protease YdiL (CAAX protease family)
MQRHKKLVCYFSMAYFFSWIVFVPLALNNQGVIFLFPQDEAHARTLDLWHAAGGIGPYVSALITLAYFNGKEGLRIYFNSYSLKKLTLSGWLLSFSPLILFAVAMLVGRLVNHEWFSLPGFFRNNDLLDSSNFLLWFLPLVTYGFGEEGGWRGYALPQLQSKYSAMRATILLTMGWLGWHIPTFFYRYHLQGSMLVGFILGLFAGAICMTFLYNFTKGSLLAVSLWHFTFNLVSMIGTEVIVAATMSTVIMILAAFIMIKFGMKDLSPFPKEIAGYPRLEQL